MRFKLYFATPAISANGWLPCWLDVQSLRGQWDNVDVQLIAAAVGKPQAIGGRDLARNSHRYIRRAVPAGSVYFFETGASDDEVLAAFDGQCVSDLETDARIGFGLCYVGGW
jgi:CRISPR-associated protein Cmr3